MLARVLIIKLTNSIDSHLGNDCTHKILNTSLVAGCNNLFRALLAFFHTLGKQLQAEGIEIVFQSRLPVDVFHALVKLRYFVDVEF